MQPSNAYQMMHGTTKVVGQQSIRGLEGLMGANSRENNRAPAGFWMLSSRLNRGPVNNLTRLAPVKACFQSKLLIQRLFTGGSLVPVTRPIV